MKVTAPTLAQVPRPVNWPPNRPLGPAMTAAPGPGQVPAEDQLRQEPGHDIGANPGS